MALPNSRPLASQTWRLNLLKQRRAFIDARTSEERYLHLRKTLLSTARDDALVSQTLHEEAWKIYRDIETANPDETGYGFPVEAPVLTRKEDGDYELIKSR